MFRFPAGVPRLLLALLLSAGRPVWADIGLRSVRPAIALPQSVELYPGQRVQVPLAAHGQIGKSISFVVRNEPAHGALTEFHQTGQYTATVIYTHRAEDGPGIDTFTYAVQAAGTPVSAAATVSIHILDLPPRLVVPGPAEVDFGSVKVGAESRRNVTLENAGGGVAVGSLNSPSPWEVLGEADGEATYRLAKGERKTFTLVFRPGVPRPYSGDIYVGNDADQSIHLAGSGEAGESEPVATPPPILVQGEQAPLPKPSPSPLARNASPSPPAAPSPPSASPAGAAPPVAGAPASGASLLGEPPIRWVDLRDSTAHSLTISWKPPIPRPPRYRVELRRMWLSEIQELQIEWEPYEQVTFNVAPDMVRATLRDLPAHTHETIRVVALDSEGVPSAPSGNLQADTLPERHWWEYVRFTHVLFAGLLVCVFLVWKKRFG